MSFYGDIKRVQSSPFVFDKYYPNRAAMEDAITNGTDKVYIGRYVLIKYTCKIITDNDGNENTVHFDKYTSGDNDTKEISEDYIANVQQDRKYNDTFDGTVWQKIYTHITDDNNNDNFIEKYIMVAELNASVPRLELDVVAPKKYINNNGEEVWVQPQILETASSEDAYTFQIPNTLYLDVGDMEDDFYGKALIQNPAQRVKYNFDISTPPEYYTGSESDWSNNLSEEQKIHYLALSPEHNYMKWTNKFNGNEINSPLQGKEIDTKELTTQLYAFGQVISDLYDALYGIPASGEGIRPFYTNDLSSILSNYDKGLVGILSSLSTDIKGDLSQDLYERAMQPGMYYYFTSKWGDAQEDPDSFIENIPKVIGSASEFDQGKCHYKINFSNDSNQNVLVGN